METKLMIVTHGTLGKSLLETSSLIVGEQRNVETYGVDLGCDVEKLKSEIRQSLKESFDKGQSVIVLTDIFYGTPFNVVVSLMEDYDFMHITGINLSIVLEILLKRNEIKEQDIDEVIEEAKKSMINCRKFLIEE